MWIPNTSNLLNYPQTTQQTQYEEQRLNRTLKILSNNDSVLNCLQFINLIQYYFNDSPGYQQDRSVFMEFSDNNQLEKEISSNKPIFSSASSDNKLNYKNGLNKLDVDSVQTCFPCIVCSTQFSFEQTFHLHLERRSIVIRFYCMKCETFKTFYNPCKLLYHIYSHKLFIFEPIYKSIKIESITLERLNLSKEKNIDLFRTTTSRNNGIAPSIFNSYDLRPARIKVNDNEQVKNFLKRLLINKFMLYKCPICSALFFDLKELRQHLFKAQQIELNKLNSENTDKSAALNRRFFYKNLKQKYLNSFSNKEFNWANEQEKDSLIFLNILNNFSFKKLQFSTRCSTIANMNLINSNFEFFQQNQEPLKANLLICPECGQSFDPVNQAEKFRLHLLYGCMFTMKYDCGQIKCPNCPVICDSVNKFVRHWSKEHVKNHHECDLCDKQGKKFLFKGDSSLNGDCHSSSSGYSNDSSIKQSNHVFKPILEDGHLINGDESSGNEPNISNISDINKHFFDKHRNQQVSLKMVYSCMCKSNDSSLNDTVNGENMSITEEKCFHSTWKSCYNHIISLVHRTLASLTCLLCDNLIPNEKYHSHLKNVHNLDKIIVCPLCGVIEEESLQIHINSCHSQLNLNEHPTSSFFNLQSTLNAQEKTQQMNHQNNSLPLLQKDFFIYQCLNCHHFFPTNCTFSHNCWTYTNNSSNTSDQKQPSTNNNYFSPIFYKFNVTKLLNSRFQNSNGMNINGTISECTAEIKSKRLRISSNEKETNKIS